VYLEIHPDRTAAMRRERSLKALSRARKLDLIRANGDLEAIAPNE
jgi:predicted GIY-YIG superfamily endonuclease